MPERKIEVIEYKCNKCCYQWISRTLNNKYKDKKYVKSEDELSGGKFYNMAKKRCFFNKKRYFHYPSKWSDEIYVNYKPKFCPKCKSNLWDTEYMSREEKTLRIKLIGHWDNDISEVREDRTLSYVCRCFLYKIRPTIKELRMVLGRNADDTYDAPFDDLKCSDSSGIRKRRENIMLEILKSHGIIITPEEIVKVREQELKEQEERDKAFDKAFWATRQNIPKNSATH
jgi:hypothetical protein